MVATITLTGTVEDGGLDGLEGFIELQPSGDLIDTAGKVVVRAAPIRVKVSNGVMTPVDLIPNDAPGISGGPWVWNVTHRLRGTPLRTYPIQLLVADGPSVSLADKTPAAPVTPLPGVAILNTGTLGQVLTSQGDFEAEWVDPTGAVDSVNGRAGAVVGLAEQTSLTALSNSLGAAAFLSVGQTAGTVAAGNDSRIAGAAQKANNLSDLTNIITARSSLGLGGSAILNVGTATGTVAAGDDGRITGALQTAGHGLTKAGTQIALTTPIASADLPAAGTAAQGAVQVESSAAALAATSDIPSVGVSNKISYSDHAHPLQPWEFSVLKAGALGDLNCVVDAVTNGTTVVTSASGKFTAGMVGMSVAGKSFLTSGQTTLRTTVASFQSATQVTLSAAATSTATGLQMVWGTNDTAAFQAAQNSAMAYGNGSPFSKVVRVVVPAAPGGFGYMIDGNLTSTDGTNAVYNGQIVTGIRSDRLPALTVEWISPVDAGFCRHWNSDYPHFTGSSLFSPVTFTGQTAQATSDTHSISNQGNPAVISGPTGKNGYGVSGTNPVFNNVTIVLTNISIINAHSSSGWSIGPFNFHGMARAHLRRCAFGTSGVVQYYTGGGGSGGNTDFATPSTFSGGASLGGLMPAAGNNASNVVEDCVWNGGYTYGPLLTEHTVCKGVNTSLYNWIGVGVAGTYGDGGSGAGSLHAIDLGQFCIEACSYHLGVWGAGAGGIGPFVRGSIDTEGTVQVRGVTNIAANLQALMGEIRLVGSPSTPIFTFGTGLRMIKDTILPGPVAALTLTINVASINTYYRPAKVTLSGGTVTTVKVSQLAGGAAAPAMTTLFTQASGALPLMTIEVGPGQWIEIDGTVLPTAVWVLG